MYKTQLHCIGGHLKRTKQLFAPKYRILLRNECVTRCTSGKLVILQFQRNVKVLFCVTHRFCKLAGAITLKFQFKFIHIQKIIAHDYIVDHTTPMSKDTPKSAYIWHDYISIWTQFPRLSVVLWDALLLQVEHDDHAELSKFPPPVAHSRHIKSCCKVHSPFAAKLLSTPKGECRHRYIPTLT